MIHIICIQWGKKFPDDYVNKLYKGIKANTSKGFLFTCFSDRYNKQHNIIDEVDVQPIPYFTGDWYSKIGLYNKELYNANDQIFFFDLDTVIIRNLDELLSYSGEFIIVRDFYRPKGFQSCFMSWRPASVHHMWKNIPRTYKSRYGDQGWPEEQYPTADIWQDVYPGQVASYKVHIRDKKSNRGQIMDMSNVSVLCFHGRPALHEVAEYWNLYD